MATLTFEQLALLATLTALSTAVITLVFNSIFHSLKNRFDWFHDNKKFKRDYYFQQLKELYIPLYAIVAQSEYLRRFEGFEDMPYDEIPFIEIVKTKSKIVTNLVEGTIKRESVKLSDSITEFNKEKLVKMIIDSGIFASQELLRLAVAYRYVHMHYTDTTIEPVRLEKFQTQELQLINRIVRLIVKECNEKLKSCGMPYNIHEIELSTMIIDYNSTEHNVSKQ